MPVHHDRHGNTGEPQRRIQNENETIGRRDDLGDIQAAIDAQRDVTDGTDDQLLCWLIMRRPAENRGMIRQIRPDNVIGRGRDNDIRCDDPRMSRQHAVFTLEATAEGKSYYALEPLYARNGVYVNGEKIESKTPIKENDVLRMGNTVFVVKTLY